MFVRAVKLVVIAAIFSIAGLSSAYAQENNPSDWCHQPSDVYFEVTFEYSNYSYLSTLGVGLGGVRVIYQDYNRRIALVRSDTREVLQVVQDNIDLISIGWVSYSPNCRYLAVEAGIVGAGDVIKIWDLSSNPASYIGEVISQDFDQSDGIADINWSPNEQFGLIGTSHEVILWNFPTNTQTVLSRDIFADCDFRPVGCVGTLVLFREVRWQLDNSTVWVNLPTPYAVTYDLETGQPVQIAHDQGYIVTGPEAETVAARLASPFGCRHWVHYQTYNHRIAIADYLNHEHVSVIEPDITLSGFQFLGWSPSCHYIAAITDHGDGQLALTFWNVVTGGQTSRPVSDYADRWRWSTITDTIDVITDAETFTASP